MTTIAKELLTEEEHAETMRPKTNIVHRDFWTHGGELIVDLYNAESVKVVLAAIETERDRAEKERRDACKRLVTRYQEIEDPDERLATEFTAMSRVNILQAEVEFWDKEYKRICVIGGISFITIYRVELVYGGPEEGGWWDDSYVVEETVMVDRNEDAEKALQDARERVESKNEGLEPYTNVNGGVKYVVEHEAYVGQNAGRRCPHYE